MAKTIAACTHNVNGTRKVLTTTIGRPCMRTDAWNAAYQCLAARYRKLILHLVTFACIYVCTQAPYVVQIKPIRVRIRVMNVLITQRSSPTRRAVRDDETNFGTEHSARLFHA